jgi:hypothetical protein
VQRSKHLNNIVIAPFPPIPIERPNNIITAPQIPATKTSNSHGIAKNDAK